LETLSGFLDSGGSGAGALLLTDIRFLALGMIFFLQRISLNRRGSRWLHVDT